MNQEAAHASGQLRRVAASDARTLARGSTLSLVGTACGTVLQFTAFLVITHGLTTGSAGVFFGSVALFMILTDCTVLGADAALVRFVARLRAIGHDEDVGNVLLAGLVPVAAASCFAGVCAYAAAEPIARTFFEPGRRGDAIACIRVLSAFIPAASLTTVALAGTRGFGSMREYVAIQNICMPILRLIGVVCAVALGAGLVGVSVGWGVPIAVGCVLSIWVLSYRNRSYSRRGTTGPRPFKDVAAEVWGFAGPRAVAGVLGVLITWFDVLLVSALSSSRNAAIYAAVSRLLLFGASILQAIGLAVASQFSELIATDQLERVERLYQLSTWWMMALSWPLYTLYLVLAPIVMSIFGQSYSEGQSALVILAFAGLFNLSTGNVTLLLLMTGKSALNLANSAVVLAMNVGLDLLLIPRFGIEGAALGWAASIVANNVAGLVELRSLISLRHPFGSGFWLIAGACIASFGGIGLLARFAVGGPLALAATIIIATPLYGLVLWSARQRLGLTEIHAAWQGGRRPRRPN